MIDIYFEDKFYADLKRLKMEQPQVAREFCDLVKVIRDCGDIPDGYGAHKLSNRGGLYSGFWEFHLKEGRRDVVAVYRKGKRGLYIRFLRIGSHAELFR